MSMLNTLFFFNIYLFNFFFLKIHVIFLIFLIFLWNSIVINASLNFDIVILRQKYRVFFFFTSIHFAYYIVILVRI